MNELPIIQKTYDLIKWYVPQLSKLPQHHKYTLGNRLTTGLYDLLESLLTARYSTEKIAQLQAINIQLEILRYQTRLLFDFELINSRKLEFISQAINDIGQDLGNWIKQQSRSAPSPSSTPTKSTKPRASKAPSKTSP